MENANDSFWFLQGSADYRHQVNHPWDDRVGFDYKLVSTSIWGNSLEDCLGLLEPQLFNVSDTDLSAPCQFKATGISHKGPAGAMPVLTDAQDLRRGSKREKSWYGYIED